MEKKQRVSDKYIYIYNPILGNKIGWNIAWLYIQDWQKKILSKI